MPHSVVRNLWHSGRWSVAFRRIRCGIGGNRVWHSGKSSFHLHLVQIASPVFQVAYTAVGMQFIQQVQIHIRHKNHFGIRSGFRTLAVCGKAKSQGVNTPDWAYWMSMLCTREDCLHCGYHYKALVFDGTSMGAHLYAAVSILRIGKERNKEYLHALVRHDAAQFGELYIVAYQHAYLSTVRIESLDGLASAQSQDFISSGVTCIFSYIS